MIRQGKDDSETRDAASRLEEKLQNHPEFRQAVVNSFIASSSQEGENVVKARENLDKNPYLQSPS